MELKPLTIPGAYTIQLAPRGDARGRFTRLFCAKELEQIGHTKPIVNVNHSYTRKKGTIRGMHFQRPPHEEVKIIKCLRGAIFDVLVDIRPNSPTYLAWVGVELTATNDTIIYIPEGCAHGFQSLTDDVEIVYFVSEFYSPEFEDGLRFDDPRLAITWSLSVTELSSRDAAFSLITD